MISYGTQAGFWDCMGGRPTTWSVIVYLYVRVLWRTTSGNVKGEGAVGEPVDMPRYCSYWDHASLCVDRFKAH